MTTCKIPLFSFTVKLLLRRPTTRPIISITLIATTVLFSLLNLDLINCKPTSNEVSNKIEIPTVNQYGCPFETTIEILNYQHFNNNNKKSRLFVVAQDDRGKILDFPTDSGIVSVECASNDPVTWEFKGQLTPDVVKSVVLKRNSLDPQNNVTFCYRTVIHIDASSGDNFQGSGFYVCSHVKSQKSLEQKSLYFYGRKDLPKRFAKPLDSEVIHTGAISRTEVVVPCRGNSPHFAALLTKQDEYQEGEYHPLSNETYNIVYDPKAGFTITLKNSTSETINSRTELEGTYKCSTLKAGSNNSKNKHKNKQWNGKQVVVIVGPPNFKKPERSNDLKIDLVQGGDGDDDDNSKCQSFICYGDDSDSYESSLQVSMSVIKCSNAVHCGIVTRFLDTLRDGDDISALNARDTNSLNIPGAYTSGVVICRTNDKMKYQYAQFYRSVDPYENKILLYQENSDSIVPASVMKIDMRRVQKAGKKVEQAGMNITCTFTSFPFARGSKWLLEYSNGTISSPNVLLQRERYYTNMMTEMEAVVSDVPQGVSNLICLAPLWNSDEWINLTYPVESPKMLNASEESLTLCNTDTDKTIFCEATGSPNPTLAWYKDGMIMNDATQNAQGFYSVYESSTRFALHFDRAETNGKSIAGVYTCNATNFVGTTSSVVTIQLKSNCWS